MALPDDEDDDFEELRRGTLFPGAPHSIAKQPDPVATQSVFGLTWLELAVLQPP